jgi:dihydroorotate dehydrogenase (fumarate)
MSDLRVNYMGLELKNPFIVGACNLVTDIKNLKKMEAAGASAIIYKSLFEEQIQLENLEMHEALAEYEERNAEMRSLFPDITHAGPEEYLTNIKQAKESLSIPVIASLNGVYKESWIDYAKKVQKAGVDGIELNFYAVPDKFDLEAKTIEEKQIEIVKEVTSAVTIPVSVKLSSFYTNTLKVIADMEKAGAKAFVLFNRLFQPDIDIDKEVHHFPYNLSNEEDNRLPIRYAGLLYANIKANICANTGVFTGKDAVKMILAGADCVQVVSTLYKHQIDIISFLIQEMEIFMKDKGYNTINDFKGKLSKKNSKDRFAFKRAQYVDILMKSNEIFKKYPLA